LSYMFFQDSCALCERVPHSLEETCRAFCVGPSPKLPVVLI